MLWRIRVRARPGARARMGPGDVLMRMRHTHKMATKASGSDGRAPSFAIWYLQFVGRRVEKKEEERRKRWRKSRFDRFPCITVAVYFSYFGSVVG